VPNGASAVDNCGICDNDPSNDCDMDCDGEWGGSLENDECGVCGGPGLGGGSYYMDCWDGDEYCSNSDCPIDPSAVSYKIYRNGLGIAIAEVQGITEFTDIDLNYSEQYCYTVTYVNGGVESHHSNPACAITDEMPIIEGCMSSYACNYDENATVNNGSCWFVNTGCSCEAGQGAVTDNCGVCDIDSSNDCIPDCNGDWGGSLENDECGVCGGNGIADGECDCNGNILDECGVCGGDNSTCSDCAGIPNGDSELDNCGTCDDDPLNDCTPDCNGEWGGDTILDECGVCDGGGIQDGACDCAGNVYDNCDVCGGDNTSCSWTVLTAAVEEINQIALSWDAVGGSRLSGRSSSGNRNRDCSLGVCLSIENVDTGAGTLDIVMMNQSGCSYCSDDIYDNQDDCETYGDDGTGDAIWNFDPSMDDIACSAASGGWFDGYVGGFNFTMTGIDIGDNSSAATGGSTAENSFTVSTSSLASGNPKIVGFSLAGTTIPPGSGVLFTLTFSSVDSNICIPVQYNCEDGISDTCPEDLGANGVDQYDNNPTISDAVGDVTTASTDCYCVSGLDECGVCGGPGIADGACDCYGNIEDDCGVCGGDDSSCMDCAGVPNGDSVVDNCGICDNDPSNDCDMDCDGEWGGSLENDECGICGGPDLGGGSYDMDCWDGDEYCSNSDCPIDPSAVSYKIYRNGLGIAIDVVQGITEFTDIDLNYSEQYCYTVTYVNGGVESHHSNQACAITNENPMIPGCISPYACNYDENATVEDGTCWFVNTGCSCEAGQGAVTDNCGVCDTDSTNDCTPDCSDTWGGTAVEDECGVCNGEGIPSEECDCFGNVDLGCGCGEAGPSGCDEACGSTLVEDECGVCGGDNSTCERKC